jgi:hypothetical protein
MWTNIEARGSFSSIVQAICDGCAISVTNGSFDRLLSAYISSTGWVIFDPHMQHLLQGSFYEVSPDSS